MTLDGFGGLDFWNIQMCSMKCIGEREPQSSVRLFRWLVGQCISIHTPEIQHKNIPPTSRNQINSLDMAIELEDIHHGVRVTTFPSGYSKYPAGSQIFAWRADWRSDPRVS